ncbi:MAG: site-2 protease family protein [Gemmatimonadota bacterium]|jgi:Zn-dependent protease
MRWSFRLGRIIGIDVFMHATFLLLLLWVGVSYYLPRRSLEDAWSGIVFILTIFGIVVLHELGHALTARRFGVRTRDITLLPIGGVARLERMPEDPRQEFLVALAGPAVNVALALLIGTWMVTVTHSQLLGEISLVGGDFLQKLLWVNVGLAVFNMIPAFPMDGGRVLRALLAMRMDYAQATHVAASVGQMLALGLGFLGLFTNPFLVFIALFVWMGAAGEASLVQMRSALSGIPVSRAMVTDFQTLDGAAPLHTAVDHILAGFQHDFPVLRAGVLVGVLVREDLMKALAKEGAGARVEEVMRSEYETADPADMLEPAFMRLQSCACRSMPVVRGGRLLGILTTDNVGEFLMFQAAMREAFGGSATT